MFKGFLSYVAFPFVTLLAVNSFGAASAMFPKDDAVILIQGPAADLDAANLFKVMKAEAKEEDGILKKHVAHIGAGMITAFSLSCNQSKTVEGLASCTLRIPRSSFSHIDKEKHHVLVALIDSFNAPQAAKKFDAPNETGEIFRSSDNRLLISAATDENGKVESFNIDYRE